MTLKITGINVHLLHRYLYAEVQTDAGISGGGEFRDGHPRVDGRRDREVRTLSDRRGSAADRAPLAVHVSRKPFPRLCGDGRDQCARRRALGHRGQALRRAGAPSPRRTRSRSGALLPPRVRETREELLDGILKAKAEGYTAVGHLTPFLDEPRDRRYHAKSYVAKIRDAIRAVEQYRDAVGEDVDLCIEIHRRLTPRRRSRSAGRSNRSTRISTKIR